MKKALLTLGGALLLIAALFLIQDYRARAAARPRYAFDTASAESVVRLQVTYQGNTVLVARDAAGKSRDWKTGTDGYPADTVRLHTVLDHLVHVQTKERVSEGGSNAVLAEFGLDSSEGKRVEWSSVDGKKFAILVGKTSGSDFNSTFWKFTDKPEVYRTPGSFTFDISVQQNDWRDRNVFPAFRFEDVQSVTVDWLDTAGRNVHYRIVKEGDTVANLVEPFTASLPPARARSVLMQTPQFVIDDFVVPGDSIIGAARLDTPTVVIRTVLHNGEVHTLNVGRHLDGMYYAKHPAVPGAVIKIASWRLNFFRKNPAELLVAPPPDTPDPMSDDSFAPPGAAAP